MIWGLFLSGWISHYTASPGVLQALRLQDVLLKKRSELSRLEVAFEEAQSLKNRLSTDRQFQEQQIRSVLGYAADDELVFLFR